MKLGASASLNHNNFENLWNNKRGFCIPSGSINWAGFPLKFMSKKGHHHPMMKKRGLVGRYGSYTPYRLRALLKVGITLYAWYDLLSSIMEPT